MKRETLKKLGFLLLISLFVFLSAPYNLYAQFDKERILSTEQEKGNAEPASQKLLNENIRTSDQGKKKIFNMPQAKFW